MWGALLQDHRHRQPLHWLRWCMLPFRISRSALIVPRLGPGLDGWWWTGGKHKLYRVVGRLSVKADSADLRDFSQRHAKSFHAQIHDQLAHIRGKTPCGCLSLCTRPGRKQADHSLLFKGICFPVKCSPRFTSLFGSLARWIARSAPRGAITRRPSALARRCIAESCANLPCVLAVSASV